MEKLAVELQLSGEVVLLLMELRRVLHTDFRWFVEEVAYPDCSG